MEDPRVRLVGVVDADPAKAGRDLGEILGEGRVGMPIDADLGAMLSRARPEVTVLSTTSDIAALRPTLERCLESGTHVVTSCENLASPELLEGDLARKIDEACRKTGVVVLATGVNPGFAMDRLPVMLSQATRNIRRVRVTRVVDAASRRSQLQAKAGIGLSAKEFSGAVHEGRVGHAGLGASLRLVAKGLGVALDRTAETLRPLIAETPSASSVLGPVSAGAVRGIYQVARGYRGDTELITLELIIALDEPNARDTIDIVGEPPLHFSGELPGDHCTVATILSAIPLVVNMIPGLRTVLDLPAEQPEEPLDTTREASSRDSTMLPSSVLDPLTSPPKRRAPPPSTPELEPPPAVFDPLVSTTVVARSPLARGKKARAQAEAQAEAAQTQRPRASAKAAAPKPLSTATVPAPAPLADPVAAQTTKPTKAAKATKASKAKQPTKASGPTAPAAPSKAPARPKAKASKAKSATTKAPKKRS
jgi:4-hydroxy-tetrahydrodipicolinate reductase